MFERALPRPGARLRAQRRRFRRLPDPAGPRSRRAGRARGDRHARAHCGFLYAARRPARHLRRAAAGASTSSVRACATTAWRTARCSSGRTNPAYAMPPEFQLLATILERLLEKSGGAHGKAERDMLRRCRLGRFSSRRSAADRQSRTPASAATERSAGTAGATDALSAAIPGRLMQSYKMQFAECRVSGVPSSWSDMDTLKGKTLFITGASRGIGLAIALRAARDGANVAIAAKSDVPNPKLPGTIHSAAAAVEAAGGNGAARSSAISAKKIRCAPRSTQTVAALRRHRHPGQQRQRDLAARRARHADEALRPDAAGQRARHVSCARRSVCRIC